MSEDESSKAWFKEAKRAIKEHQIGFLAGHVCGLQEAAGIVENFLYAFEGNDTCREVNANLRKAAAEIRARAALTAKGGENAEG